MLSNSWSWYPKFHTKITQTKIQLGVVSFGTSGRGVLPNKQITTCCCRQPPGRGVLWKVTLGRDVRFSNKTQKYNVVLLSNLRTWCPLESSLGRDVLSHNYTAWCCWRTPGRGVQSLEFTGRGVHTISSTVAFRWLKDDSGIASGSGQAISHRCHHVTFSPLYLKANCPYR